ncbi:MAG TPA: GNAT family N-acetyltransferase [Cyanobacteria bacterium UBA8803]|nr:GNAT family N-acetyltransferase [Cyanobacteria bacterium UBA9273]HBL57505.1 GNAT family N-acetyltransferase [Cyanobacteria bacterium UBA8803]
MTEVSLLLPMGCSLRRACVKDMGSIRKLVLSAKLDPTQLRWQQFWVIECEGNIVACAQLRNFSGAQELGSLVVAPTWRDRGLGTALTQHLIQQATAPLYLECLGQRLPKFYSRFGFVPISGQGLPQSLKFKFAVGQLARIILRLPVEIMQYQGLRK